MRAFTGREIINKKCAANPAQTFNRRTNICCICIKHMETHIKLITVETRNFEIAWFDIPVASMSF